MPELPEVEAARKRVHSTCLGHVIAQVEIVDDTKVYDNETPENVKRMVVGKKIVGTQRKGKYFWLEFDAGPCLIFHLGMTGNISIDGMPSHKYKGFKTDYETWPPRFWKMHILLDNGVKLAYTDPRSLNTMQMTLMHTKINEIITKACSWDADYKEFPEDWIFHHRWGKQVGAKVDGHWLPFVAGGVAAVTSNLAVYPLTTLVTRIQSGRK
eukprot:jgi/Pico_ML_1/52652/g3329.t1